MAQTAVVMAVYHPNEAFLDKQIASLSAQSDPDFELIVVIADADSSDLVRTVCTGHNLAPQIICPGHRMNAISAFELGLQTACATQPAFRYIALADQDDVWHPDRLSAGIAALEHHQCDLAHSDARVIDAYGQILHPSLFALERRPKNVRTADLLYQNTVTGMTVTMTRELAEHALNFPPQNGTHFFHDLWLALVASTRRGIAFVDAPLVDYRKHGSNVVGPRSDAQTFSLVERIAAYTLSRYLARTLVDRGADPRPVRRFLGWRGLGTAHLWQALKECTAGRGARSRIAGWAFLSIWARWVWAAQRGLMTGFRNGLSEFDAKAFAFAPGVQPAAQQPEKPRQRTPWWSYRDGRTALKAKPELAQGPDRVVIFVPTLNPTEAFAGIATAIDLGLGLLQRGQHVAFVATDMPIAQRNATRQFLQSRLQAPWPENRCDVFCGVTDQTLVLHPNDQFIATAWWTAQIAQDCTRTIGRSDPFWYLIQDFEPCFYPWGTEYAMARASYDLPHKPIFNSAPLQQHFIEMGLATDHDLCFHPAIQTNAFAHPRAAAGKRRRLMIYGRPDVARNLFPLCIDALGTWLEESGIGKDDLDIVSLGQRHEDIELPGDIVLRSLGKLSWEDYPRYLASVDMGLSLMCSPHPSHPPIEMAMAGVRVVTNDYGPKCLGTLSNNIISVDLSRDSLVQALHTAWIAGPASPQTIDLSALGPEFDEMLDQLTAQLRPSQMAAA